jgi:hypothetical protein
MKIIPGVSGRPRGNVKSDVPRPRIHVTQPRHAPCAHERVTSARDFGLPSGPSTRPDEDFVRERKSYVPTQLQRVREESRAKGKSNYAHWPSLNVH